MPCLAGIFGFAYNEELLLRDWIGYYGELFGYTNIHVVDNRSTDATRSILQECHERLGVNVYECSSYRDRSDYVTQLMKRVRHRYRFLIPLDIDEFIVAPDLREASRTWTGDGSRIQQVLEQLPGEEGLFCFSECFQSVERQEQYADPLVDITEFFGGPTDRWSKVFFRAEQFQKLGGGNHTGEIMSGSTEKVSSPLALFHFHYLGAKETLRRAEHLCAIRGYPLHDDNALRMKMESGAHGSHRIRYLLRYRELMASGGQLPVDADASLFTSDAVRSTVLQNRRRFDEWMA